MKLKPLNDNDLTPEVKNIFSDIKSKFKTTSTPVIFKFLANFPEYLEYLWIRLAENLDSSYLNNEYVELKKEIKSAISESYKPSKEIINYINSLSELDKENILKTVKDLENVNIKLLIFMIAIRENLKGVFVGENKLEENSYLNNYNSFEGTRNVREESYHLEPAEGLILYKNSTLQTANLANFYSVFQNEFEKYSTTNAYLEKRLELERKVMIQISDIPYSLGASYQKLIEMIGNKPHFTEILYLLTDYFPSSQPKICFAIECMSYLFIIS